ncbi:hypothetical protein G7Z17_g7677 [Cylindrodendrum hubeiense]|uniref:2-dehydropantoate 2-reductase n=1 Tax=Cylindrodendrum hubeiense TaxID=595255 RepID=A0A9P5H2K2_9HYPO|nr:hypothetical protein G7Z17_g7677 [Cylindrodendrum hubeiense]
MGHQDSTKKQVLLLGSGGVGTIGALNLEAGGQASVTAVLSSPTVVDLIAPAVVPGRTVIVLIQNGLNIEKPIFEKFPDNICLSGVSMIGSHEVSHGVIEHEYPDELILGAFHNPRLDEKQEEATAKQFVEMYAAGGKTTCTFAENVPYGRWRKLIYNACLNSICGLTGLDSGRIRLANDAVATLVRPAMEEIRAAAAAAGVQLEADICDFMIDLDPLTMYLSPSMLVDVQKGNLTEVENLVGEPLRTGTALGVPMPTLSVVYNLLKAMQWHTMEKKGKVTIPARTEN